MRINFYEDPLQAPHGREDVRINNLGLYLYPDRRRVAVGFDITPFLERPSIQVTMTNARGEEAGVLTVIETMEANFTLTMHLRDAAPTDTYDVLAEIYYLSPEKGREVVDQRTASLDLTKPGEQ